jgi:hypothetical protein
MYDKRHRFATAVSFPGAGARFKVVSTSEITTSAPNVANRGHGEGDDFGRCEAQQQRGVPFAVETGAIEISAREIGDVSARPGRLLTPPFGLFLRAALLAHLERTFR